MAHPQETKNKVRRLYIEGMALTAAALAANVNYDTARAWKKAAFDAGDNWETLRSAFSIGGQNVDQITAAIGEMMMRQAVTIMHAVDTDAELTASEKVKLHASLSDSVSKSSKALSSASPKLGAISVAMDTIKVIGEYFAKHDKDMLDNFQNHLSAIGTAIQKRFK